MFPLKRANQPRSRLQFRKVKNFELGNYRKLCFTPSLTTQSIDADWSKQLNRIAPLRDIWIIQLVLIQRIVHQCNQTYTFQDNRRSSLLRRIFEYMRHILLGVDVHFLLIVLFVPPGYRYRRDQQLASYLLFVYFFGTTSTFAVRS